MKRLGARPHGEKSEHERGTGEPCKNDDRQDERERSCTAVGQEHDARPPEAIGGDAAERAEEGDGQKRRRRCEGKPQRR